jgi:type II secretory pathway component HofQ
MLIRVAVLSCVMGSAPAFAQKRITLEVQKADVVSVLRVFAELMHLNLVVADDVQGQVTLSLRNVRITEAFSVVLQARGLGYEKQAGNILRVATLPTLTKEAEERARLQDAKLKDAKLETRLIPVNYANADDLVPQVKALLSPRGTVSVDKRTNTLIVRDVAD